MFVLDTHVLLWLVFGDSRLSRPAKETIDMAADANMLRVPAIVFWEIGILTAKNRFRVREPLELWVRAVLARPGLQVAPLTAEIAVESTRLPDGVLNDPADCIIVATARRLDATLITRDKMILAYGAQGRVCVLRA
jgi:PIN domain nuclease of toxin-antitoxin system